MVKWNSLGLGEVFWTIFMIGAAILVTLIVILTRGDAGYSLVIIWALAGIIAKQIEIQNIVLTAGIGLNTFNISRQIAQETKVTQK